MDSDPTHEPRSPVSPPATSGGLRGDAVEDSALFVGAVQKALVVLSVFKPGRRRLSLSQIASLAGMSMGSAQRFTHTLWQLGLIRRIPGSKLYDLSPRMLDFAYQYIAGNDLVAHATPFLQQLSIETEETVNLTVLDGTDVIFVQRIVSRHVLTPEVTVGTRLPAYCTSSGLAILAALPAAEARAVLDASERVEHTQYTVTDNEKILQRLRDIRTLGYAHTENELYLGDISTAVAVVDADGYPLGAINVAVAQARWKGAEHEARIASLLLSAGRAISSRTI